MQNNMKEFKNLFLLPIKGEIYHPDFFRFLLSVVFVIPLNIKASLWNSHNGQQQTSRKVMNIPSTIYGGSGM